MKQLPLAILLFLAFEAKTQSLHFLYFQSENKQPFYIKFKDSIYSSTESGYAIISKLKQNKFDFVLGFPKNHLPSQRFDIMIEDRDRGFLIKEHGTAPFELYDIQTHDNILAKIDADDITPSTVKDQGEFKTVLAEVTGNPTILEEKINAKENQPNKEDNKYSLSNTEVPLRLYSKKEKLGFLFKYAVTNTNQIDTVDVFISEKNASNNKNLNPQDVKSSGCVEVAGDIDFFQLRKNMASAQNEKKMLDWARVACKQKCFYTAQIRNLAVLFLSDESKMKFFEFAYAAVVDKNNFGSLRTTLTEQRTIDQFNSLAQ